MSLTNGPGKRDYERDNTKSLQREAFRKKIRNFA